ncbi:MAG: hypothetical protein CSA62_06070 [Planctomycetota bacterium]|nr:MAG: hypothetical protein CSA62_06070 [Planctomycetota bacterium]
MLAARNHTVRKGCPMKIRNPWLLRLIALLACVTLPMACNRGSSGGSPLETEGGTQYHGPTSEQGGPGTQGPSNPNPTPPTNPTPNTPAAGNGSNPGGGTSNPAGNPPVPEPTTFLLVGAGLATVAMLRGRKRSVQEQIEEA